MKWEIQMEKIVVLRNPAEENTILVQCLQMLFPECEIEVRSRKGKTRNASEFSVILGKMNKGHETNFNSGS